MSGPPVFLPPRPQGDPREPAAWGARAGATLVDALLITVLAIAAALLAEALGSGVIVDEGVYDDGTSFRDEIPVSAAIGVATWFVLWLTYPWILLGAMRGVTPGRRVAGVRVVHLADGRGIGFGTAFVRDGVLKGAFWMLTLPLFVDYLMPLFRDDKRALHDLIAGTRVVQDAGRGDSST